MNNRFEGEGTLYLQGGETIWNEPALHAIYNEANCHAELGGQRFKITKTSIVSDSVWYRVEPLDDTLLTCLPGWIAEDLIPPQ